MPIALALLGVAIHALGQAGLRQQDIERRTEAQTSAQLGLERLTRELRQADWVFFRNSAVIDMQVGVRATATGSATPHLVRWDCSTDVCERYEGGATPNPPPAAPTFTRHTTEIGSVSGDSGARYGLVAGPDVFFPAVIDPATGTQTVNPLVPAQFMRIRLRMEIKGRGEYFVLEDGVSLRNTTTFADG